jgi:single-stranded-DNA-specific exonuclease
MIDQRTTLSYSGKKWCISPTDERLCLSIIQKYQYPDLLARLLAQRWPHLDTIPNHLSPTLKAFLPDPSHLQDMDQAVTRLEQAIQNKEKICVFGDYDVDGATSTALLLNFFRDIGYAIDFYIPDRQKEGYGPSPQAFSTLSKRGTNVIITVDCGSTAFEAMECAKALGMDVIIVDHHRPETTLPKVAAFVNPYHPQNPSPYNYLAAVGVTFLLLVALARKLKDSIPVPDLRSYLDLVALGTVCDVVPLKGLNRAYVRQGLKVLDINPNIGLKTLIQVSGGGKSDIYQLGFILGPRINAGGRIGDSSLGVQLLTTRDPDEALRISQKLEALNQDRKLLESQTLEKAIDLVETHSLHKKPLICLGIQEGHVGIIGIVAGRLKEKFHKPVFVIGFDGTGFGKGSGRSIDGVNLSHIVHMAKDQGLLLSGGGHAMAAGLSIEEASFSEFQEFLDSISLADLPEPTLMIDAALPLSALSFDTVKSIEDLGPFGAENPAPLFLISNVYTSYVKQRGDKHFSCTLKGEDGRSLEAICFNSLGTPLEKALIQHQDRPCSIAGTLQIDTWQGREKLKFMIQDVMAG